MEGDRLLAGVLDLRLDCAVGRVDGVRFGRERKIDDSLREGEFAFCWIVDFPMFEYDETVKKVDFSHNPFSMPQGGLDALERERATLEAALLETVPELGAVLPGDWPAGYDDEDGPGTPAWQEAITSVIRSSVPCSTPLERLRTGTSARMLGAATSSTARNP